MGLEAKVDLILALLRERSPAAPEPAPEPAPELAPPALILPSPPCKGGRSCYRLRPEVVAYWRTLFESDPNMGPKKAFDTLQRGPVKFRPVSIQTIKGWWCKFRRGL